MGQQCPRLSLRTPPATPSRVADDPPGAPHAPACFPSSRHPRGVDRAPGPRARPRHSVTPSARRACQPVAPSGTTPPSNCAYADPRATRRHRVRDARATRWYRVRHCGHAGTGQPSYPTRMRQPRVQLSLKLYRLISGCCSIGSTSPKTCRLLVGSSIMADHGRATLGHSDAPARAARGRGPKGCGQA